MNDKKAKKLRKAARMIAAGRLPEVTYKEVRGTIHLGPSVKGIYRALKSRD